MIASSRFTPVRARGYCSPSSALVSTTHGRPSGRSSVRASAASYMRHRTGLPTRLGGAEADPIAAPTNSADDQASSSLRLLSLISASVAIQAQTQRFEQLAGRSAMIGVLVALVAELLTEESIFRTLTPDTAAILGALFAAAVAASAAAAAASKRRLGRDLLEPVITSLTAAQRSAASVTGRQVDNAVDSVLNKAFSRGVICSLLVEDSLDADI